MYLSGRVRSDESQRADWTGEWRRGGGEGGSPAGFPGGQGPRWQVNQEPGTLERGVEGRGTLHTQGPEKCGLPHGPPRTECEMVRERRLGPLGRRAGGPAP